MLVEREEGMSELAKNTLKKASQDEFMVLVSLDIELIYDESYLALFFLSRYAFKKCIGYFYLNGLAFQSSYILLIVDEAQ